jgi:hypothetical protein
MFNRFCLIFFSIFILILLLISTNTTFGKSDNWACEVCGGSGKNRVTYKCCAGYYGDCSRWYNCVQYYDPAFPIFEYESSATKYSIQNFMPAILLSFFLTFFFAALIPKSRLFILKIFSKILQIKPQIIQTKCKYYSSYWLRKFKNYL